MTLDLGLSGWIPLLSTAQDHTNKRKALMNGNVQLPSDDLQVLECRHQQGTDFHQQAPQQVPLLLDSNNNK